MLGVNNSTTLLLFFLFFTLNHSVRFKRLSKDTGRVTGLYDGFKEALILNRSNFEKEIFQEQKQKLWLIEFYKHWCGYCIRFVPIFKEVAIIAREWRNTIGMGTIDCANPINEDICRHLEIKKVPTLRIFHPNSDNNSLGFGFGDSHTTVPGIIEKLVLTLKSYQQNQTRNSDPVNLKPLKSSDLDELWKEIPSNVMFLVLVFEPIDSAVGSVLALDLSRTPTVRVRLVDPSNKHIKQLLGLKEEKNCVGILERYLPSPVNANHRIFPKRAMEVRDFTKVDVDNGVVMERKLKISFTSQLNASNKSSADFIPLTVNNFTRDGINKAVRRYLIDRGVKIAPDLPKPHVTPVNVTDEEIKEAARREGILKKTLNVTDLSTVVFQMDLEIAISDVFKSELAEITDISGEPLKALKHFMSVVIKYFPRRKKRLLQFFIKLREEVLNNKEKIQGRDIYKTFKKLEQEFKPFMPNQEWVGCRGTTPRLRGYPCGLWTMFHTLVVQEELLDRNVTYKAPEALNAMVGYIKHFFACRGCSEHFTQMASTIPFNVTSRRDAVMWLWRAHNNANQRLAGDITEDPRHHKVQFPTADECPSCHKSDGSWDQYQVFTFIHKMFTSISHLNPHGLKRFDRK